MFEIKARLARLDRHKDGMDFTMPGFNYLGPGTPIQDHLYNAVKPTSELDREAFNHDFEYLTAQSVDDLLKADQRMITAIGHHNPIGQVINEAFNVKNFFGLNDSFLSNLSDTERELYTELYKIRNNQWYGTPYDITQTDKVISKHTPKFVTE